MYQGCIGKLETRKGVVIAADGEFEWISPGWYIKLREGTEHAYFFGISFGELHPRVVDNLVDESMCNKYPDRPYYISCSVPVDVQLKNMKIDCQSFEAEINKRDMREEIERLYTEKRETLKELNKATAAAEDLRKKFTEITISIDRYEQRVRSIDSGNAIPFIYAYGKHGAAMEEYCWRVPDNLVDKVKPGDTISVETKYGQQCAVVTRIERNPAILPHKMVLDVLG
jgi:hypothetical protein